MKSSLHRFLASIYFVAHVTSYFLLVTSLHTNTSQITPNSTTNTTAIKPVSIHTAPPSSASNQTLSPPEVSPSSIPAETIVPQRPIQPDKTCRDAADITPDYGWGAKQPHPDVAAATPGSRFAFYCRTYFILVPTNPFRECQEDGSWSGTDHKCIANSTARCSEPDLPAHSQPRNPMREFPIFAVLQMQCKKGWVGRGNMTVQCDHRKKWQIDFSCVRGCPDTELPQHSSFSPLHPYSNIAVNETVPVVCKSGYHLLGVPEVTCNASEHMVTPQFGCCPNLDTYDRMRSAYNRNPEYYFGPLIMIMALVNVALVIKLFQKKKHENKIISTDMIKVKPTKAIELQSKSDSGFYKRPKDIAQHVPVRIVKTAAVNEYNVSPYRKISRDDTF